MEQAQALLIFFLPQLLLVLDASHCVLDVGVYGLLLR